MVEVRKYTVRPYKPARADRKDSLRVYLSATALHYHGLRAGELCQLSTTAQSSYPAIVWPSSEKLQDTVIQTTKSLQTLYSLRLGDQISVSRSLDLIRDAHEIVLSEHQDSENKSSLPSLGQEDRVHWAWILEYDLKQAAHVCPGMIFADVRARGEGRTFQIIAINGSSNKYLYHSSTLRSVVVSADPGHSPWRLENHEVRLLGLDAALVGGLSIQLSELNCAIAAYGTAAGNDKLKPSHLPRRGGILLHGPSGTGKSMLLRIVAQAGWRQVFRLQDTIAGYPIGDTDKAIHNIFSEARRLEPSVVIIDDLEAVARKRDPVRVSEPLSIAGSLCKAFDQRVGDRVLVIAATKKLALVDESLRRPGRFQTEVEIPVPGADARAEILHIAYSLPKTAHDHQLLHLAKRTHGYVGSDLVELIQSAMDKAVLRIRALNADKEDSGFAKGITEEDIEAALLKIRPTAMKEIFLDTPKVQWSQIGGQAEVKEALQEAVEWPLKVRCDRCCPLIAELTVASIARTWNAWVLVPRKDYCSMVLQGAQKLSSPRQWPRKETSISLL